MCVAGKTEEKTKTKKKEKLNFNQMTLFGVCECLHLEIMRTAKRPSLNHFPMPIQVDEDHEDEEL